MKIGLLGGSFNPPHLGHIHISLETKKKMGFNQIWWLPAKQNPLKKLSSNNQISFKSRFEKCKTITKNHPQIKIKNYEEKLTSLYTIDILRKIIKSNRNKKFYLIIGADNILQFHLWKNWQQIINLAPLIVCDRDNFFYLAVKSKAFLYAKKRQKIKFLHIKKSAHSSTKIRQKMNHNFFVDSHCHLDLLEEKGLNIDQIIQNCKQDNVQILQTICTKISQFDKVYQYTEKYSGVFASIGIHPCNVEEEPKIKAKEITKLCENKPKIIGIGETGLDYFHPNFIRQNQIDSFIEHIKASRETGKPLIIHSRSADADMAEILSTEMKKGKFKALLHCFSSSKNLAQTAIDLGVFISISGIITFNNASELQNIIKDIPLEFLLIETDAPYLAPIPHRGKVNQPQYVIHTAEFLANLKGVSLAEIAQITSQNFVNLFGVN